MEGMKYFVRGAGFLATFVILCGLLIAALFWALSIGTVHLSLDQIYGAILQQLESGRAIEAPGQGPVHDIVWLLRLPRLVLAALVGAGLSVCGVVMQEVKDAGVDTLILGCTHYPLLTDIIREIALEMIYIDIIIVISQIRQFQDIYPSVIPALPFLHHSHVAELIHQLCDGGHGTVHGRCHITDPDDSLFLINNMNTPDNADVPGLDPVRKIRQNLTDSASLMTGIQKLSGQFTVHCNPSVPIQRSEIKICFSFNLKYTTIQFPMKSVPPYIRK